MLRAQFAAGTPLHAKVQEILTKRGDFELALHCRDPREAAAQGFALWRKGLLDAAPPPVTGLFSEIVNAVRDVFSWLRREIFEHKLQTPQDVFQAFANGTLAQGCVDEQHDSCVSVGAVSFTPSARGQ